MAELVAYDVSDDQRRARLAAVLQAFGDRSQKSVFLISVAADELAFIMRRPGEIINHDRDSLWVLRQCQTCWVTARAGQAEPRARCSIGRSCERSGGPGGVSASARFGLRVCMALDKAIRCFGSPFCIGWGLCGGSGV